MFGEGFDAGNLQTPAPRVPGAHAEGGGDETGHDEAVPEAEAVQVEDEGEGTPATAGDAEARAKAARQILALVQISAGLGSNFHFPFPAAPPLFPLDFRGNSSCCGYKVRY